MVYGWVFVLRWSALCVPGFCMDCCCGCCVRIRRSWSAYPTSRIHVLLCVPGTLRAFSEVTFTTLKHRLMEISKCEAFTLVL